MSRPVRGSHGRGRTLLRIDVYEVTDEDKGASAVVLDMVWNGTHEGGRRAAAPTPSDALVRRPYRALPWGRRAW